MPPKFTIWAQKMPLYEFLFLKCIIYDTVKQYHMSKTAVYKHDYKCDVDINSLINKVNIN